MAHISITVCSRVLRLIETEKRFCQGPFDTFQMTSSVFCKHMGRSGGSRVKTQTQTHTKFQFIMIITSTVGLRKREKGKFLQPCQIESSHALRPYFTFALVFLRTQLWTLDLKQKSSCILETIEKNGVSVQRLTAVHVLNFWISVAAVKRKWKTLQPFSSFSTL